MRIRSTLIAATAAAGVVGIAWAALEQHGSGACNATMGQLGEARNVALQAVERANESDDEARDVAAMALQRWQATLERATKACEMRS